MDALKFLMQESVLSAEDVEHVVLSAGSNVLSPIRFQRARTELEGKFSFQFLLAAIILAGKAGKAEFTDSFVSSPACQTMQGRIETRFDQQIEDMGWDRIRSRIDLTTRDGRMFTRWADENYRGGPHHPISDAELEDKFRDCAAGILDEAACRRLFADVWMLDQLPDVSVLWRRLAWRGA